MTDLDVLQALNHLGVRGQEAAYAYLRDMRAAMKARGAAWTPVTVAAELALRGQATDADAGQDGGEWEVTPAGENDQPHDLAQLDTGAPGN